MGNPSAVPRSHAGQDRRRSARDSTALPRTGSTVALPVPASRWPNVSPSANSATTRMTTSMPSSMAGTPNDNREYVEAGTIQEVVLWNPIDLGYLAVHVANAQVTGNMPSEEGATFEAGRLGEVELIGSDEVLLGPPLVFTEANIDDYNF